MSFADWKPKPKEKMDSKPILLKPETEGVLGNCPNCGERFVEEKHRFKDEEIAVGTCPNNDCYDWEIPKPIRDLPDPTKDALFAESESWAYQISQKMAEAKQFPIIKISIRTTFAKGPTARDFLLLSSLARRMGKTSVSVIDYRGGIKVEIT